MKFTLNWLKTHLETDATLDDILEALTDLGLEVEGVEDPAERLGAFRTCRVIEAAQHPDADRLRLCRVETWPNGPEAASEEIQVVCGAPNAKTGLIGVFAPVGTDIPGTGITLKPGVIRGVESNGMLCSERELELSDDHDGIIELPADTPLGVKYIDYAGKNDPTIEIAITPNRPDALGVAGIARDLAARGLGKLITAETSPVKGAFPSPIGVTLNQDVSAKDCPLFIGRYIKGVKNGPSPQWLQDRLKAVGLRPISILVDITNFLCYDRNRPLHVFDADKLSGNIEIRKARAGETLKALDEEEYTLDSNMTAVCDDAGPQGIGAIMGGFNSGCSDDTVNVFLEGAYFDQICTAMTGRKLKINSDARYRFERGIDPDFTQEGVEIATQMILDLCGGEASELVIAGAVPDTSRSYKLDPARVISLVGMEIPREEQIRILTALGFSATGTGETLEVWVPSWRPDVHGEADLVEEVARVASLTKLQGVPLPRRNPGVGRPILTPMQMRQSVVRRTIATLGYNETVTYSFIDQKTAALFGGGGDEVMIGNPISSEMSHMRPTLLPSLLQAAAKNQARGFADLALFEIGQGFVGGEPEDQQLLACGVRVGQTAPRNAHGTQRAVDIYDAKADAEAALSSIKVSTGNLMAMRNAPEWFHPGRSAMLCLGPKNPLAAFGEIHPKILSEMGIKGPAVAFTLFLENAPFPKSKSKARPAMTFSDFQPVERDFAFVVDAGLEVDKLLKAARGADKKMISDVTLFDVFEGEKAEAQMGAGKKSVAIAVRMEPQEGTLTDKEIDAVADAIIAKVTKATGGSLRG